MNFEEENSNGMMDCVGLDFAKMYIDSILLAFII